MVVVFVAIALAQVEVKLEREAWKQHFDEANRAYKSKDYAAAERGFRQALAATKDVEKENQARAFILDGLAASLVGQQKFAEAEPYLVEAAGRWSQSQGSKHPNVARSLSNLGNIRKTLRKYAAAREAYSQAMVAFSKSVPPTHPDVRVCMNNLADLYFDVGDFDHAGTVYRQLLVFQKGPLTTDHAFLISVRERLARCLIHSDKVTEAEPIARQAMLDAGQRLPEGHPLQQSCSATMAMVYLAQRNVTQAKELLEEAIEKVRSAAGDDHPALADFLAIQGALAVQTGDWIQADQAFSKAEALTPERDRATAQCVGWLKRHAEALSKLGQEGEAQQRLKLAEQIQHDLTLNPPK